uniref:Uncharacterized protein n=1 Tax=Anguilla anguilla TaxID=7936 RepID=A0A0E9W7V2_ANGAN
MSYQKKHALYSFWLSIYSDSW